MKTDGKDIERIRNKYCSMEFIGLIEVRRNTPLLESVMMARSLRDEDRTECPGKERKRSSIVLYGFLKVGQNTALISIRMTEGTEE